TTAAAKTCPFLVIDSLLMIGMCPGRGGQCAELDLRACRCRHARCPCNRAHCRKAPNPAATVDLSQVVSDGLWSGPIRKRGSANCGTRRTGRPAELYPPVGLFATACTSLPTRAWPVHNQARTRLPTSEYPCW